MRDPAALQSLLDAFRLRHEGDPFTAACEALEGGPIWVGSFCRDQWGSRRYFVSCRFHKDRHGAEKASGKLKRIEFDCPQDHMCHPFLNDQHAHVLQPVDYDPWRGPGSRPRRTIVCVPHDMLYRKPGVHRPRRYIDLDRDYGDDDEIAKPPPPKRLRPEEDGPSTSRVQEIASTSAASTSAAPRDNGGGVEAPAGDVATKHDRPSSSLVEFQAADGAPVPDTPLLRRRGRMQGKGRSRPRERHPWIVDLATRLAAERAAARPYAEQAAGKCPDGHAYFGTYCESRYGSKGYEIVCRPFRKKGKTFDWSPAAKVSKIELCPLDHWCVPIRAEAGKGKWSPHSRRPPAAIFCAPIDTLNRRPPRRQRFSKYTGFRNDAESTEDEAAASTSMSAHAGASASADVDASTSQQPAATTNNGEMRPPALPDNDEAAFWADLPDIDVLSALQGDESADAAAWDSFDWGSPPKS